MRLRIWLAIGLMLSAVTLAGCSFGRIARGPAPTPVPTKTLRPTFTHTPVKQAAAPLATPAPSGAVAQAPTAVLPTAAPATAAPPTETPAPPTPEPSPTPKSASFTVASTTVNVRGGPGTNYDVLGRLQQGQTYPVTGKNAAGDWWQFDYNGRSGWVSGQNVNVASPRPGSGGSQHPAPPRQRVRSRRARRSVLRPPSPRHRLQHRL